MKEKERRKRLDDLLDRVKWTIDHRIVTENRRRRILRVRVQAATHYLDIIEMVRMRSLQSISHITDMFPQIQYSDMVGASNGRIIPPHSTHELADLTNESPIWTFKWATKHLTGARKNIQDTTRYYEGSRKNVKDAKLAQAKLELFMTDYKERFLKEKTDDKDYDFKLPGHGYYNVSVAPLFNFIDEINVSEASTSDATS